MAARRPISTPDPATQEDRILSAQSPSYSSQAPAPSNISPMVPASTLFKLLLFTVMMFAAPLLSYFISVRTFFAGNTTYAGALAAFVANVVLIAYIVVAVYEDQGEEGLSEKEKTRREKEKKGE